MGDQEYYFDEQDQQEHFVQGKYSMGISLFPINFNTFNSYCMCHLDRYSLELNLYLVSYGICERIKMPKRGVNWANSKFFCNN